MSATLCTIPGCERPHRCIGLCEAHYRRIRKYGRVERVLAIRGPTCTIDGCNRPHQARGLCKLHYERLRRTDLLPRCTYTFGHGPFGHGAFGGTCPQPRYGTDGLCQTHHRWATRRATHPTLTAEVESWGYQIDIPLEDFVRHQDYSRLTNRRKYA